MNQWRSWVWVSGLVAPNSTVQEAARGSKVNILNTEMVLNY
jgi:hypothetical protein